MVKLGDFLQVAHDTVVIEEKGAHVVEIDPLFVKVDLSSKKLLDSTIKMIGSLMSDGKLHGVLEGDIKDE